MMLSTRRRQAVSSATSQSDYHGQGPGFSKLIFFIMFAVFLQSSQQACTNVDEYQFSATECRKCEEALYGCATCAFETVGANSFLVCTMCQDGLYLLKNDTFSSLYPAKHSFCVPNCRAVHQSFTNSDSGFCEWAGEYCTHSDQYQGCQIAPTHSGGKWSIAIPNPSTHLHDQTFKENSYPSQKCVGTSPFTNCPPCAWKTSLPSCGANPAQQPQYEVGLHADSTGKWVRCKDGYADVTQTACVHKCPPGYFGWALSSDFTSDGGIQLAKCYKCHDDCKECVGTGNNQCLSCSSPTNYVQRGAVGGIPLEWGSCNPKGGTNMALTVIVDNKTPQYKQSDYQSTSAPYGTTALPMNNLIDGIAKAYELGAQYITAKVVISIANTAKSVHWMMRLDESVKTPAIRYIPSKWDETQLTDIVIQPAITADTQTVYLKLRDKYQFKVGKSLSISYVKFEMLDSIVYYERSVKELWELQRTDDASKSCTVSAGVLGKCNNKNVDLTKVPRLPKDDCQVGDGLGAGLFRFNVMGVPTGSTASITTPVLTLDNVIFNQPSYNFNSFIELNDVWGKVVIKNSQFLEFNTCGAIIRNKRFIYNGFNGIGLSTTSSYMDFYKWRHNKILFDEYTRMFTPSGVTAPTCESTGCFQILFDNVKFDSFGQLKPSLTVPVAVNPNQMMQYTGQVLDLDNFDGQIGIYASTFNKIALRYSSCSVAGKMITDDPALLLPDKYAGFGTKSKYQIKSVISIVNQLRPVHIIGSFFTGNSGTKGIIYIDMKESLTTERVIFFNNQFKNNAGYVDSNVIFIRARTSKIIDDPAGGGSMGTAPNHCSGYSFEKNLFENNIGCVLTAGSAIKFECINTAQTGTNYIDQITTNFATGPPWTWVSDQYKQLNYGSLPTLGGTLPVSSYAYAVTSTTTSYTQADKNFLMFKQNKFYKNYGSGGRGLVDIYGVARVKFDTDDFQNNGDSHNQLNVKLNPTPVVNLLTPIATSEVLGDATQSINAAKYPVESLMKSMISIQRGAYIDLSSVIFNSNWLLENGVCNELRAQLLYVSEYAGDIMFNGMSIVDHKGLNSNTYISGTLSLKIGTVSTYQQQGAETPLFRFAPSVQVQTFTVKNFQMSNNWYIENSACSTFNYNYLFGFSNNGGQVNNFIFGDPVGTQSVIQTLQCKQCTKPLIQISELSQKQTISNIKFSSINDQIKTGLNVASNPLMAFQLYRPYQSPSGSSTYAVPTVSITLVTVDGYYPGGNGGQVFSFKRVPYPILTDDDKVGILSPTTETQITIDQSTFNLVQGYGDGVFATADIDNMIMQIKNSKFTDIKSSAVPSHGVLYGKSMGQLFLSNVKTTGLINYVTTSAGVTTGGGRFLYINQPTQPFSLTISGGSIIQCASSIYTGSSVEYNNINAVPAIPTQGSCFEMISDTVPFTVSIDTNTFQYCYGANQGGVFSIRTLTAPSMLPSTHYNEVMLKGNSFLGNAALQGGSIFCQACKITTDGVDLKWSNNQFKQDYALYGGNIYLQNIYQLMSSTNFMTFENHYHTLSTAKIQGGGIYYTEELQEVHLKFIKTTGLTQPSEYTSLVTTTLEGGAFYISAAKLIEIQISDTTFSTNFAGTSGGGFYFATAADRVDVKITNGVINSNKAKAGHGGFMYMPVTSLSSDVIIDSSELTANLASVDGGVFYMAGAPTAIKFLKLTNLGKIDNQVTTTGNGGVAYISGLSSEILIEYPSLLSSPTINTNNAGKSGGLFYSIIDPLSTKGCIFNLHRVSISGGSAVTGTGGLYSCEGGGPGTINLLTSALTTVNAGSSGGAFFMKMTSDITMKIDQFSTGDSQFNSIQSITSTFGSGGLAYLETAGSVTIDVGIKTDIKTVECGLQGGVFLLGGALTNKLTFYSEASVQYLKSQEGSAAVFWGTDNHLKSDIQFKLVGCAASKNAGCFKMQGTNINEVILDGNTILKYSPSLLDHKASTGDGGFLYMMGMIQTVSMKEYKTTISGSCGGRGGVIFSDPQMAGATVDITINSGLKGTLIVSPVSAGLKGSFLYAAGTAFSPTVTVTVQNAYFQCVGGLPSEKSTDICQNQVLFGKVYDNLKASTPVGMIGGLFFFEPGVKGKVKSITNDFKKCYNTNHGAVWNLPRDYVLDDSGSVYTGNAGLAGMIYCDQCIVVQKKATYDCNMAKQATILYMLTGNDGINAATSVTISDALMIKGGRSFLPGGGIYVGGSNPGALIMNNDGVIQFFESESHGGFFYVTNPAVTLQKVDGTNFNHLKSFDKGGYIEGTSNLVHTSFAVDCRLGNISDENPPDWAPTFSGSSGSLNVKGCDVTCGIGAQTIQEQQQQLAKLTGLFSLYQISNLVVVAEGNTIRNCTAVEGAIFKFDSADFTDFNSVFENNGADKGGVAYCYKCKMRFVNSTFRGNYANQGGIFYIQQYGELLLENVTIESTRAHQEGGIVYGNGVKTDMQAQSVKNYVPALNTVQYVEYIKITIKMNEDRNFTGLESLKNGAGVYLKNGMLMVDNMTISMANAMQDGGFIYSDGHVEITINNSTFKSLQADRGGFMFSNDSEMLPPLSRQLFLKFSTLNFLQSLQAKTAGGGFYVNNSNMDLILNTPINVLEAKTTQGHGGMFYLERIKSIDFKQIVSTDVGKYTKLTVPHPSFGSFMYSKALNANIDLQNLLIQCQEFAPVTTSIPDFRKFLENQNVLPNYGGAIYVADATLVKSQMNTFENCYQTNEGGIFHITTDVNAGLQTTYTKLQELGGSVYQNNQAEKGGIIFCEKCILEMIPSQGSIIVQDNWAKQGGAIFIQEIYQSKIGSVSFLRNTASIQGGVIAAVNNQLLSPRSTVLLDSTVILNSAAQSPLNGWGGSFYFETVQLSTFTLSKCTVDGSYANIQGGIFFVEIMSNGLIQVDQATKLNNFFVSKKNLGSLFYSSADTTVKLSILDSFVTCNTTANWIDVVAAVNAVKSYRAGSIYMENSQYGVVSNTNTYENCSLAEDGGIYYIVNSKVLDTNSRYIQTSALYGSVMKCRNCEFTFQGSQMENCFAESGGAFMIENDAIGFVFATSFRGTHARNQGGLMNVVQSGLVNLADNKYIIFDSCPLIEGNSANQGGVFYLNQPNTRVKVVRSVISKSYASDKAGVIYVQNALEFTSEFSTIINIFSKRSLILYSTSTQLQLNIISSKIICNSSYVTFDNVDEFKNQNVNFSSTNSFYISGNQQTQIKSQNSQYSQCGMLEDGGLYRLEGKVNFYDQESQYFENSGVEGGVFSCSQCNMTLYQTVMKKNLAKRGGVIKLEASGNLTSMFCGFYFNQGVEIGGVVFVTTQSLFNIMDSSFMSNFANLSSCIDVLGSSSYLPNRISRCQFQNNTAIKNTVSFKESKAIIENTKFRDNYSTERSKNLFVAFAEVNITECYFSSPEYPFPSKMLAKDRTMGAFIFIILDVKIIISNSIFTSGLARYGGAIYISGQSDITIDNCQIMKNEAQIYGGAIFANGFRSIKIINGTKILDNKALLQGDDFYLSNTEDTMELNRITVSNAYAKNSLYAEQVSLVLKDVKYHNMQFSPSSLKGAAIQCFGCRKIDIQDSWFKGIKSQVGGALHLTDMPTNKRLTDGVDKYRIENTMFEYIQSNLGGALYLDHPQYFQIINSTFLHVRALNRSQDVPSSTQAGVGGSIYYHCSIVDPQCQLQIMGTTHFQYNYAAIKGGAIHYTYYEPKLGPNVTFELNRAGWYGNSISSYAQQLKQVSPKIFNRTIRKIDNPLTYLEFLAYVSQYQSNKTARLRNAANPRQLEVYQDDEEPLVEMFQSMEKEKYTSTNQRSGGSIPDFQLALVDKYGQIVSDFDSKIRVTVDTEYFVKDEQTRRYTPVLEGTTQFTSYGGVSMVSNLMFSGAPGYKYRLAFLSSGIDEKLPENALFKERYKDEQIEFDFFLELRECEKGEYFSLVGKCIWCEPSMGYALVQMKEPGECKPCPWDKGNCKGGYHIGPLPGYWRKSNTSANMMRCPNHKVCYGWVEPTWNQLGQCAEGHTGVLCAQCMPGYSLTGLAQCAKCPDLTSNVVKMVGITILIICLFAFMVRSTLAGATQQKNNTSIYMKILMNHFQLILLVSSFNFQWPKQIEVFFSATSPVSEASSQIVSIDCFMSAKASFTSQSDSFFKTYFLKLLIFALIPFILAIISWFFWWIQKIIRKTEFQGGKFVATLVISLFTIHPNIVQTMFNDYNCKDIDGDKFVLVDMTIKCWDTAHSFWSYSVAMPSIIVWGLGIPFFALVLMTRERHHLDQIETKEKFGFLYNGYTQALFFWEIVIMYRKIAMIFISVFIQPYGVISQALIVFMLMIVFLIANLKKKPYLSMSLNDLETISLITSTVSIYCGIFFITDIPAKDVPSLPTSVKSGITLSEDMKFFFFIIIMVSNLAFFGYWFFKIIQEIRNTFIKKFEKGYLYLFLCGDKVMLEKIKRQIKIDEENELLREKYFKSVSHLKNLYKEGKLVLTQQTLERAQVYLNEDRYMDALGLARRDVTEKELKRFQRMAQGAEVKHNEREKAQYSNTFVKNMDMRRDHIAGTYIDPTKNIQIDEEYMQGLKKNEFIHPSDEIKTVGGKVVGIRPESQQTIISGASGYNGETENINTQGGYLHSTPKNTTQGFMDEDGQNNQSQKMLLHGTPNSLDQTLVQKSTAKIGKANGKHQVKKNSSSIEKGSDIEDVDFRGKSNKRGKKAAGSSDTDDENNNKMMWNDLEEDINIHHPKALMDQFKNGQNGDNKAAQISKKQEPKLSKEASKKKKEDEKLYNGELDIGGMIRKGDIEFQASRVKGKDKIINKNIEIEGKNNKLLDRNTKKPQTVPLDKGEKNTAKIEKDIFKDLGIGGNISIDSDNEVKHKPKKQKKVVADSISNDSEMFSDEGDNKTTNAGNAIKDKFKKLF